MGNYSRFQFVFEQEHWNEMKWCAKKVGIGWVKVDPVACRLFPSNE